MDFWVVQERLQHRGHTDIHTYRRDWKHYPAAFAAGKNILIT